MHKFISDVTVHRIMELNKFYGKGEYKNLRNRCKGKLPEPSLPFNKIMDDLSK